MAHHEQSSGETEIHKHKTDTHGGETTSHRGTEAAAPRAPASWASRMSWGAIFAGTVVALVTMAVLNILGIAIGAVALDAAATAEGFGIGAGIWWTVSALIALFIGGWTAGHFSSADIRSDGLMHGVVTWGLFVLASFLAVTTTIGQVIGGAFGVIGQNLSAVLMAMQPAELTEATLAAEGIDAATIAEMEATMAAAGEQALEAMAIGAGWAFVALVLGVLVSALGGSFGVIEPEEAGQERGERFASRFRRRQRA